MNLCVILRRVVFPEVTGIESQRLLQVTGVEGAAADADGAAHHPRQNQDSQKDGPPMSLQRQNK